MATEVELLHAVGAKLVPETELEINFSTKSFNRFTLSAELEREIDDIWEERCRLNFTLWNGMKFRLHSHHVSNCGRLHWNVGLTCYKDFLGTNFSPKSETIRRLAVEQHANSEAYFSNPLGVGALLLTSDDRAVVMKRSSNCAEAPGLYDIPGGHPEPEEIVGKCDLSSVDTQLLTPESVRSEIYASILKEIRDEVNIPLRLLSPPLLLGVALNKTSCNRPSAEFLVRTGLTSEQVTTRYTSGTQAEADETTEILTIPHTDVISIQQSDIWSQLAPSAKGCFLLYLSHLDAVKEV